MPVKASCQFTLYDKPEGYLGLTSERVKLSSKSGYVVVVAHGLIEALLEFCKRTPSHAPMPPQPFAAIVYRMVDDLFSYYAQSHPDVTVDEINEIIQELAAAVAGIKIEEEVKDE